MEKSYLFLPVILMTFITNILFTSCSKQKNELPTPISESAATANVPAQRFGNWGSITGVVLPPGADVQIVIYNRNFKISDFYYNKDGSFQIDKIPAGMYTVVIIDLATAGEYVIPDIKVSAGKVINIGVIKLQ